jgi:hypothetical protein
MKKAKAQKKPKTNSSKKQDEPLMGFDELVHRIIRVKPHEVRPKKN